MSRLRLRRRYRQPGVAPQLLNNSTTLLENTALNTQLNSDQSGVGYSLAGGADLAKFTIVGGHLRMSAKDFESPTDADADNVYVVVVRVSKAGRHSEKSLAFTVTDQEEAPGESERRIRSNETIAVDLTDELSHFSDEGNFTQVTFSCASGAVKLDFWLRRTLTGNDSGDVDFKTFETCVHRDILDALALESTGAAEGLVATIQLDGWSGPGGTGTAVSRKIDVICDNTPPTTWHMGAKTLALEGGLPLHTYFAGDAADWRIKAADDTGHFDIRRDAGRNLHRLVRKGAGGAGAAPNISVTGGQTVDCVLENPALGLEHTVAVTFVAGQTDVAPWPATDDLIASPQTGTQLHNWASRWTDKTYGEVCKVEDGDYNPTNTGMIIYYGTQLDGPAGSAPGTPYAGGWYHNGLWSPHASFIRLEGRSPRGANLGPVTFDIRAANLDIDSERTNRVLGLRVTNLAFRAPQAWGSTETTAVLDGANYLRRFSMVMFDHCDMGTRLGPVGDENSSARNSGIFFGYNHLRSGMAIAGEFGIQVIGNVGGDESNPLDGMNWAARFDPDAPYNEFAFNKFHKHPLFFTGHYIMEHQDVIQMRGQNGFPDGIAEGPLYTMRVGFNIFGRAPGYRLTQADADWINAELALRGQPPAASVGDEMPSGAEGAWSSDVTAGYYVCTLLHWNLMVDTMVWGMGTAQPGHVSVKDNILLWPLAVTQPGFGSSIPSIYFLGTQMAGANMSVKNNYSSAPGVFYSGGDHPYVGDPAVETNNTWDVTAAQQRARFNNADLGDEVRDWNDFVWAYSPKAGQDDGRGPTSADAPGDMYRHTIDRELAWAA